MSGPLLGAFGDPQWPEEDVPVGRDELILLYTDGVTESAGHGERFGIGRLRSLLAEQAGASPAEVLSRFDRALGAFATDSQRDDVAALALRPVT